MFKADPSSSRSTGTSDFQPFQGSTVHDLVAKGEAAFGGGDLLEAGQCFEKALRLAPFDAKIYNNLSVVHWQQGNTREALDNLTQALELDPDDQDVILNCARVFQQMGKKDDARDILEAYMERKPWDYEVKKELQDMDAPAKETIEIVKSPQSSIADFFNEHGEEQFGRRRMMHAKACFEIALDHNPDHAKAHSNLGVVHWEEGELQLALEHFYKALELNPEDSDVLFNSSKALAAAGELDTALEYLKLYLQRNPKDEPAWEDFKDLVRTFNAGSWTPDGLPGGVSDVYFRMGKELVDAGDLLGAGEAFHRALQLNADQANLYYELGKVHQKQGHTPEATGMWSEALRVDSSHKEAALALGEILASQGRVAEARSIFRDYLVHKEDKDIREALEKI